MSWEGGLPVNQEDDLQSWMTKRSHSNAYTYMYVIIPEAVLVRCTDDLILTLPLKVVAHPGHGLIRFKGNLP